MNATEEMVDDGFIEGSDIPIKIERGEYYVTNNTKFKNENKNEEMRNYKEVKNGKYYLEANNSNKRKNRIIKEIIEQNL